MQRAISITRIKSDIHRKTIAIYCSPSSQTRDDDTDDTNRGCNNKSHADQGVRTDLIQVSIIKLKRNI